MAKERLSVSIDAELLTAGRQAVKEGGFANLSAWVGAALRERVQLDERLRGLREYIASYEEEFGEITEEEIAEVTRRTRERSIQVDPKQREAAA